MWLSRQRWLDAFARLPLAVRRAAAQPDDPAAALGALATELEAQAAAAQFVDEANGAFPEVGGRGVAVVARAEITVLAVEMRRLYVSGTFGAADAALETHSADLASAAAAVAEAGGTVLGALGHRLIAEFRGAYRTLRAVAAAADLLGRASAARVSSMEAPHVAIASGEAWTGTVDYRGWAEPAAIGPPFQRLERVLHDAIPGEIVLARSALDEIAPALARAGETAVRRAGTVGAQEIYALAADAAARLVATSRSMAVGAVSTIPNAAPNADSAATRFAGRYELRECLGASADADTWKATDENGRWVVVKRLHDGTELDHSAAAEWLRVQRALTTLGSPWVVATLDAAGGEGCLYGVRPYARARSLRSILDAHRPPRAVALLWARHLASGLQSLHDAGLVHTNVRAENVLIDAAGAARWIDAGLTVSRARRAEGPDIAPEWREGRAPDAAADVFALGALFEELLLAGDAPGDGDLRRLVHGCLSEDPALRHASAGAVRAALDRCG
jgi:hypothetical protein